MNFEVWESAYSNPLPDRLQGVDLWIFRRKRLLNLASLRRVTFLTLAGGTEVVITIIRLLFTCDKLRRRVVQVRAAR